MMKKNYNSFFNAFFINGGVFQFPDDNQENKNSYQQETNNVNKDETEENEVSDRNQKNNKEDHYYNSNTENAQSDNNYINRNEREDNSNNSNNQNNSANKTPRSNTFLVMILAGVIIMVYVFYSNAISVSRQEITYSQFLQFLEMNNVESVIIIEEKEIQGQLRDTGAYFSVKIPYPDGTLLTRLNEANLVFKGANKPISLLQIFSTVLPWAVSLLFIFYLLRSLRGFSSGGGMPFVKGKVRSYVQNNEKKVLFSDVAGQEEAKYELKEVVEFLKQPEKFQKIGAKIPRGVLLVGNPGTGKTLLARACAGEANVSFFYMSGSDFVEMFAGVGAGRVRELFEKGRKSSPCLVFIDELDAVGRSRSSGYSGGVNDEREQTLNQLLVEMDGFEIRDRIIVLAATNRPDILDKALLRPGRFDRQIVVDMPDLQEREKILKIHAKNVKVSDNVDFSQLARATVGCSGADLANLINESALFAARRGKDQVELEDCEEARDKILMGTARKSKIINPEEKLRTARHEAGHAILHLLLEHADPLHKVTIIPRGRALGVAFSLPENDMYGANKSYLIDRIALCYGGYIAETMYYQETSTGVENDLQQATQIATKMVKDWGMSELGPVSYSEDNKNTVFPFDLNHNSNFSDGTINSIDNSIKKVLQMGYDRAEYFLSKHKDKLDLLASELMKHETLLGEQVHKIVDIPLKSSNENTIKKEYSDNKENDTYSNNNVSSIDSTVSIKDSKDKNTQYGNPEITPPPVVS